MTEEQAIEMEQKLGKMFRDIEIGFYRVGWNMFVSGLARPDTPCAGAGWDASQKFDPMRQAINSPEPALRPLRQAQGPAQEPVEEELVAV